MGRKSWARLLGSRRLFARLERWKPRLYCTDEYVVYNNVLPVGRHCVGEDESVRLERNNGRQWHWVASCRRRSIVVSRSGTMIDRRMTLFAHFHANHQARLEMPRLTIAQKQRLNAAWSPSLRGETFNAQTTNRLRGMFYMKLEAKPTYLCYGSCSLFLKVEKVGVSFFLNVAFTNNINDSGQIE